MGTIVAFRIGQNDVESLGKYFHPTFDSDDLLRVPNHNTIVRTLIGGIPTQPFSMATLPPLGTPRPRLAIALKQLSSAKYARPRAVVADEITKRMTTKGALPSGTASPPRSGPGLASGSVAQPKPAPSGSSFLDDWLSKRQGFQAPAAGPATASKPSPTGSVPAQSTASHSTKILSPDKNAPVLPAATTSKPPAPKPSAKPARITGQPARTLLPDKSAPTGTSNKASSPTQGTPPVAAGAPPAASSKNISSDELVKHEVDQIAAELKQELGTPLATPAPTKLKTDSEVHPAEGDTIFIDHDGSFHLAEDLKKTNSKTTE